ncbi:D-alanyl-D-alanine carboxypeptidase [compost metagenome]
MQEKNLALEQYLEYLKQQKSVTKTIKGKKYEVSYYQVTQNSTIHVPGNRSFLLSGNNMDGVIVRVFP